MASTGKITRIASIRDDIPQQLKVADLHVHTKRSDGWWTIESLAEAACELDLAGVAITDHDDCRAGFELSDYCAKRQIELDVWPGSEITALENDHDVHVLGIGLYREVRPWQSVAATVDEILSQGGIPIMPHPRPSGLGGPAYEQILALDVPVAIETYNAAQEDLALLWRLLRKPDLNGMAADFHAAHGNRLLGATGGTDAHFRTIGRGLTGYRVDLCRELMEGSTTVFARTSREHLMPWDPVGYYQGLKRLDRRRRDCWGERPVDPERPLLKSKLPRRST